MLFEQMAEVQDGRLVGRGGTAKINPSETAQHYRLVQRVLGTRIRKVEPVLQEVDSKHDRQTNRLATVASLGIIRCNQGFQLRPRYNGLHRVEKLLPAAQPGILLKTRLIRKCYLPHRLRHLLTILCKRSEGSGLNQRF